TAPVLFARDFARQHGFRFCDHLISPPFPRDGLFRRKERWGTWVEDIPERRDRIAFKIARDTPALRQLLAEMPFIAKSSRGLVTVAWGSGELLRQDDLVGSLDHLAHTLAPRPWPSYRTSGGGS